MAAVLRDFRGRYHGDNPGKPSPEVGQDLANVVAAGVQDGEDRVADGAFQGASGQATIGLHVADLCLDGTAAAQVCDEFWRQAAPCTRQDALRFQGAGGLRRRPCFAGPG